MMVGITLVMTLLVILVGLYPEPMVNLASQASESLFSGLDAYIGAILG